MLQMILILLKILNEKSVGIIADAVDNIASLSIPINNSGLLSLFKSYNLYPVKFILLSLAKGSSISLYKGYFSNLYFLITFFLENSLYCVLRNSLKSSLFGF